MLLRKDEIMYENESAWNLIKSFIKAPAQEKC